MPPLRTGEIKLKTKICKHGLSAYWIDLRLNASSPFGKHVMYTEIIIIFFSTMNLFNSFSLYSGVHVTLKCSSWIWIVSSKDRPKLIWTMLLSPHGYTNRPFRYRHRTVTRTGPPSIVTALCYDDHNYHSHQQIHKKRDTALAVANITIEY